MARMTALVSGLVFMWALQATTDAYPQPKDSKNLVRVPILRNPNYDRTVSIKKLARRDPFQTQLYNEDDSQYLIQIGIGTPAQNFTVTLDTGSADLWVPSSQCPANQCPYSRFNETSSSTYQPMNLEFEITYGIGSANGTYVKDTVTIAGASVQNQQFGLATSTSQILTNEESSGQTPSSGLVANGILGLGYPQLTAATSTGSSVYNPFVFNLMDQKLIQDPIFSIYMNSADKFGWVGEIIFGGIDSSKFTGSIVYLPVAQLKTSRNPLYSIGGTTSTSSSTYSYWMVYGQGISVIQANAPATSYSFSTVVPFIFDTGTTLSYFPQTVANEIASSLAEGSSITYDAKSQTYMVDCQSVLATNRSIQLQMSPSNAISNSPVTLSIPVSELLLALDANTVEEASICVLGIAPFPTSVEGTMFLIGDSILRSAYLVFDMGQNRVGIAAANNGGGSVNGVGAVSAGHRASRCVRLPTALLFVAVVLIGWL